MLAALDSIEYQKPEAIAIKMASATRTVQRHLSRLRDEGLVDVVERKVLGSHCAYVEYLWRRSADGIIPLYQANAQCDGKALADCFGGYSYVTQGERIGIS